MNRRERRASAARSPLGDEARKTLDRARSDHSAGDVTAAIAGYEKVLSLDPKNVDALMNLGKALTATGNGAAAIARFREASALFPSQPAIHSDFGAALAELGRWDDARAAFGRAIALAPGDFVALTRLGEVFNEIGLRSEAKQTLERALTINPLFAPAYYALHRTVYDDKDLGPSIDALSKSLLNDPTLLAARFLLAVLLDRQGNHAAANQHFETLRAARGPLDSWGYVKAKIRPETRFFATIRDTLLFALEHAKKDGLVLEFGVRYGVSTRWIAERESGPVHGFDSFQGLPEAWHENPQGTYSTHGVLPEVPPNVVLHTGLFEETLAPFLAEHPGPIRFMNVDCDIYSATDCVLRLAHDRIVPGTIIVFDEYIINDAWREDEFKAFQEAVALRGWKYEYLAFSVVTGQAVVRIAER